MMKNNNNRIFKSISRIIYIALIYYAYESSFTAEQLIFFSSACILFAPIADWIIDWKSDK